MPHAGPAAALSGVTFAVGSLVAGRTDAASVGNTADVFGRATVVFRVAGHIGTQLALVVHAALVLRSYVGLTVGSTVARIEVAADRPL
jgi:hypothetical protein